ncbi:MAG: LPS translocon maturation chaperone LptM [Gammaproteobacteria bacterium]
MLFLVLSLLSACGQKGDLYLPEPQTLVKLIS